MTSVKRESGQPQVIKCDARPTRRVMAIRATRSVAASMNIVASMTGNTRASHFREVFAAVTGRTHDILVTAGQRKAGGVMVENLFAPVVFGMTIITDFAELAVVGVVCTMAADAGRLGDSVWFVFPVTGCTAYVSVCTPKQEIGDQVIK